uniref:Uncharacterized protein n=1 Tax=viral metagenome TaxID=1070528 RepID=A0A6C0JUX1_9ZZZZ
MSIPKGAYSLLGLLVVLVVVVAFLPAIRNAFAPLFPEGFRDLDCKGVVCEEGEFCQDNVCRPVNAPNTNDVVGYGL